MGDPAPAAPGPSLRSRVVLAVALTVGFYVLALAVAVFLIAAPIVLFAQEGVGNLWLTLFMVAAGGTILASIVPRRLPRAQDGVAIDSASQPRLLAEVERVARAVGDRMPERIAVTLDLNASVLDRGGLVRRSDRTLLLGLPLLDTLTVAELRSVLAHEFGHYVGGDTRLGPWTWRTQDAILRTVDGLSDEDSWGRRAVRVPFLLYARLFLRITGRVSRQQELAADATAVRVAGRDAHVSALRKVHAAGAGFDAYWWQDVVPVLEARLRPEIAEGYRRFRASPDVAASLREHLDALLAQPSDPDDTHPSLGERIRFVKRIGARAGDGGQAADDAWAASLLDSREALEAKVLQTLSDTEDLHEWERISWADVGERVYLPVYESVAPAVAPGLVGRTFADLPDAVADAIVLGRHAVTARGEDAPADLETVRGVGLDSLGAAAVVALHRAGWRVHAAPGEPILCRHGSRELAPFLEIERLRAGGEPRDQWVSRARELGLAATPLAPGPAPAAAP